MNKIHLSNVKKSKIKYKVIEINKRSWKFPHNCNRSSSSLLRQLKKIGVFKVMNGKTPTPNAFV